MAKTRYTNAFVQNTPIVFGTEQYGVLRSEYDVREYWDLRTTQPAGTAVPQTKAMRAYVVSLRQRIVITNLSANSFRGLTAISSYDDYPLLVLQQVIPTGTGISFYLEDYSPRTLNAAVSTNSSKGTSSTDANSVQHMTGSSTSTTNAYDVSGSIGFFGADMTGSVSAGYSHSTTNSNEASTTAGQTNEAGRNSNAGASMSIKDWCSYAFIDQAKSDTTPILSWAWAQEYPWSVIDYRSSTADVVDLPQFVAERLWDGTTLSPPSQISQFGIDFVAHARWLFYVDGTPADADETACFKHQISFWQGSHKMVPIPDDPKGKAHAKITILATDQVIDPTLILNLPLLALDPITHPGSANGALVGFVSSEFIVAPGAPGSTRFRLKSGANNLYISEGSGFDALSSEDSVLKAKNITATAPASMKIQFKVADEGVELTLYFKHWSETGGCKMTILVNAVDLSTPAPILRHTPIIRHIDATEAGSGSDNITAITLRKRDYTSTEFYDYLLVGLNTITVTIEPADGAATCSYAARAVAIG